jgi:two-component system CAI-1 autoinducer sensor kinase/phosphatase CqsS
MWQFFQEKLKSCMEYVQPNLVFVGLLGSLGFPLYFLIWSYIWPQTYENLFFRLLCSVFFLPWVFYQKLPYFFRRYFYLYFFVSSFVTMPFFFSFMLLKSGFSVVWSLSYMAGLFLFIILVYDWVLICLMVLGGFVLAYLSVWLLDGQVNISNFQLEYVVIYLFAVVSGIVVSYRNQTVSQTKMVLLKSLGSSIAHEMRNPLSSLISALDTVSVILPKKPIQQADTTEEGFVISRSTLIHLHQTVEQSNSVVRRGNKIIDSILASMRGAKIDTHHFKKTSIQEVLHTTLETFGYADVSDKDLIQVKNLTHFNIFCDKDLLIYVLFNLLKNAFHYKNKKDFLIEISLTQTEEENCILVKDTGPGIPKEKLETIFDSFYTAGKKGGTGLGLHFCRRVINSFGGTITCSSEQGEWTEFKICLPLYESPFVQTIQKEIIEQKNFLVVDDQKLTKELTKRTLSAWNSHVSEAENAYQALDLLEKNAYDMVFMDLEMPGLRGDTLVERIRTGQDVSKPMFLHYRHVPFVALSALPRARFESQTLKMGLSDYFEKPLFPSHLNFLFDKYFFSEQDDLQVSQVKSHQSFQEDNILSGKKILFVDDSTTSRMFIPVFLAHTGCQLTQASNGQEAIEELERQDHDLVVMDLEMPVMGGIEATMKIRTGLPFKRFTRFESIPIIALTGNTDRETIRAVKQAGMNDHLGKPISKQDLLMALIRWAGDMSKLQQASTTLQTSTLSGVNKSGDSSQTWGQIKQLSMINLTTIQNFGASGDAELVKALLDAFIEETEQIIQNMSDSLQNQNSDQISHLAHTLKGAAGSVGAHRLEHMANWIYIQISMTSHLNSEVLDDLKSTFSQSRQLLLQYMSMILPKK